MQSAIAITAGKEWWDKLLVEENCLTRVIIKWIIHGVAVKSQLPSERRS